MHDLSASLRDHVDGLAPPVRFEEVTNRLPRRVGRRHLVLAAAAVALVAAVSVVVQSQDDNQRLAVGGVTSAAALREGGTDANLAWVEDGGVAIADPSDGHLLRVAEPKRACDTCAIVQQGGSLFIASDGIYRLDPPGFAAKRIADGQLVFRSDAPDELFVATTSPSAPQGYSVRRITTTGAPLGGPWLVPDGFRLANPPRAAGSSLVVESPAGSARRVLSVWDPEADGAPREFARAARLIDTYSSAGEGVAASWGDCAAEACDLVLTDLNLGRDRTVAAARDEVGFIGGGGFSPDGTKLAAFAVLDRGRVGGTAGGRKMRLVIVDVETGKATRVRNSTAEFDEPHGLATWSPSGRWVFFGGINSTGTGAHRLGTADAAELRLAPRYSMVALDRAAARVAPTTPTTDASSTMRDDESYPLWPERTPQGARRTAQAHDDSWRRDAAATAVRFATTVLGWTNATSAGAVPVNQTAGIRVTNNVTTVTVYLAQWSPGWWSVSGVNSSGESFGVAVYGRSVDIGIANIGRYRGTVTVSYGDRAVSQEIAPEQTGAHFELPFDPDVPGHVLILRRDSAGVVIYAESASFPAGDFAAG